VYYSKEIEAHLQMRCSFLLNLADVFVISEKNGKNESGRVLV